MHPLKLDYYQSHYLATVRLLNSTQFTIEGGLKEKRLLEKAKAESNFCYVKNVVDNSEVRLELNEGDWRVAS